MTLYDLGKGGLIALADESVEKRSVGAGEPGHSAGLYSMTDAVGMGRLDRLIIYWRLGGVSFDFSSEKTCLGAGESASRSPAQAAIAAGRPGQSRT